MRSKLIGFAAAGMQRLTRFAAGRPWLCGAAALAVAIGGLFAWFSGERWDQVDVAAAPESQQRPLLSTARSTESSLQPASEPGSAAEAAIKVRDAQAVAKPNVSPDMSDFEAFSTRERITFRSAARPTAGRVTGPGDSAMPTALAGTRGAWLVGTIEEVEDGFRQAQGGTAWPGLASHPGSERW